MVKRESTVAKYATDQNESMESKIEIFKTNDNQTEIQVLFENETAWLSQMQMANLFDRDRKTITRHIANIFKEGDLIEEVVCSNSQAKNDTCKN